MAHASLSEICVTHFEGVIEFQIFFERMETITQIQLSALSFKLHNSTKDGKPERQNRFIKI